MSTDPLDELGKGGLEPDMVAQRQAWQAARETFADAHAKPGRSSRWRYFAPLTSAAALIVACAALWLALHREPPAKVAGPVPLSNAALRDFFIQGRELFGSQLIAVTVVNGQPTWQLSEGGGESGALPQQPVVAIARITDPQGSVAQVAALPGMPVKIPFDGRDLQVEFLPTGNDQLLVTGPSLVWSSDQASSPLSFPSIAPLP